MRLERRFVIEPVFETRLDIDPVLEVRVLREAELASSVTNVPVSEVTVWNEPEAEVIPEAVMLDDARLLIIPVWESRVSIVAVSDERSCVESA